MNISPIYFNNFRNINKNNFKNSNAVSNNISFKGRQKEQKDKILKMSEEINNKLDIRSIIARGNFEGFEIPNVSARINYISKVPKFDHLTYWLVGIGGEIVMYNTGKIEYRIIDNHSNPIKQMACNPKDGHVEVLKGLIFGDNETKLFKQATDTIIEYETKRGFSKSFDSDQKDNEHL